MRILYFIRCTFRAARFPLSRFAASIRPSARISSLSRPRDVLISTRRLQLPFSSRAMGAGGSKDGGEGGGGKKKSTRKEKEGKETAAVATPAQQAETAKESGGAGTEVAEYVECTVAKTSEFGENE